MRGTPWHAAARPGALDIPPWDWRRVSTGRPTRRSEGERSLLVQGLFTLSEAQRGSAFLILVSESYVDLDSQITPFIWDHGVVFVSRK